MIYVISFGSCMYSKS